jgi:hypothetical protein
MTVHKSGATRRDFLKGAAAALAAPAFVPASTLGKGGKAAASERITVGFIACGKMANDYHLSTLLSFADVQAVAVCEVDRSRREQAKRRVERAYEGKTAYKACAAYADFRELLARKDIDAVCIATPEHWHAIPIIEACKAGKDVYCEKPLTLTLAEAQRCIDAVRKHGRVLQTGSQQRSSVFGPFRRAAEIVRSGRLGKIQTVTVGVGGPSRWCDLPGRRWSPAWTGTSGSGRRRCGRTTRHLARAVSTTTFRPGATTASTPGAGTRTWGRTITTSPSGAWGWTSRAPSRLSRRRTQTP